MSVKPDGAPAERPAALLERIRVLAGVELAPVSHAERLVSGLGGFCAIYLVLVLERGLLGDLGAALLVASMGASAVLLFAVPHGTLSQPWAVIVGHAVSAAIGVAVARVVPDAFLAAALAVGLAILAMHYLRAIHPPGGATALTAVIGGSQVQALGFGFVVMPVLLNAVILVAAAVAFNAAFAWRRYPVAWGRRNFASRPVTFPSGPSHADFVEALRRIGTFVDISEEEFVRLTELAKASSDERRLKPDAIRVGGYYSNGGFGADWAVRMVVDGDRGGPDGNVIWRVVAGRDRNATGLSSRRDLAAWAAYEVVRSESTWVRSSDVKIADD
ncbi:MAG: HPP family protein [Hyphomicrobiaceae bacterium]|nr:HPP family protein [Hyphomicrobiaceae bacterium]